MANLLLTVFVILGIVSIIFVLILIAALIKEDIRRDNLFNKKVNKEIKKLSEQYIPGSKEAYIRDTKAESDYLHAHNPPYFANKPPYMTPIGSGTCTILPNGKAIPISDVSDPYSFIIPEKKQIE